MKKLLAMAALFAAMIFTGCSNDDESDGISSVTSSSLVGRVYSYSISEVSMDGYLEERNEEITFTSESSCSTRSWGYDYTYYSSGYKKENYDITTTRKYSVSGSEIIVYDWSYDGDDVIFTIYSGYIQKYGTKYYEE